MDGKAGSQILEEGGHGQCYCESAGSCGLKALILWHSSVAVLPCKVFVLCAGAGG